MATAQALYGPNGQAITCTLTSLANGTGSYGAGRSSTAVDNTTNLFLQASVFVKVKTSASALGTNPTVYVYAYGTADGGTTYTDGVTGSDAAFTGTNPPNMRLLGVINCPAISTIYSGGPWEVSKCFDDVLPDHWGIYVVNLTGQALDASVASAWYQGVKGTVV